MTRIICFASVMCIKIRFFLEIGYHKDGNFPFAAGLMVKNAKESFSEVKTYWLMQATLEKILQHKTHCETV